MNSHPHNFSEAEWPFDDPTNVRAITTRPVIEDGHPILLVTHDEDGDWQVLCGTTNRTEDGRVVCLGCMFERDRTIGELADLPQGWRAWRDSAASPWQRSESKSHWSRRMARLRRGAAAGGMAAVRDLGHILHPTNDRSAAPTITSSLGQTAILNAYHRSP